MSAYTPKRLASKRRNEQALIELGGRVEVQLWRENARGLTHMEDILAARLGQGIRDRKWGERRQERLELQWSDGVEHGVMCFCDPCTEAVKRLLQDCGVLP